MTGSENRLLLKNDNIHVLFICSFFVIVLYFFLGSPIVAGDTDLWYHLNGGKYIEDNKSIPWGSYFSFIEPSRTWADYFWLFQLSVHKVYSFFGYYGLIILRAALFSSLCYLILSYLLHGVSSYRQRFYYLALFTFCCMVFVPRFLLIRPHMFSYLFIILFLYILECKPSRAWLLPLFSILWVNVHGIVYPVMLLIIGSYLSEFLLRRAPVKTPLGKEQLIYLTSLVLCLAAVYATPHGKTLLSIPLVSTEYAAGYIKELRPLDLENLTSMSFFDVINPTPLTIFVLIMIVTGVALVKAFLVRDMRISHLILFAGGCLLLTKGIRMINEATLLFLPILKHSPALTFREQTRVTLTSILVMVLVMVCLPVLHLRSITPFRSAYPLASENLPHGNMAFLKKINVGGKVLNYPNKGGFHQWMLYPSYKIFMDMEVPFLFQDDDFYRAVNAFRDAEVFRKMIVRYEPSFVSVPNEIGQNFKEIVKNHPEYVPVFFDDVEHLYVNRKHHSAVADQYQLKTIHPADMVGTDIASLSKEEKDLLKQELLEMMDIYPSTNLVLQSLALIHNTLEEYDKGAEFAERIIVTSPGSPRGYRLKGDALLGLKKYHDAVTFYQEALSRTDDSDRNMLFRKISICYGKLNKNSEAYAFLRKGINIFSQTTPVNDLFTLGLLALEAGKTDEALMLFKFAYLRTPDNNREMKKKIMQKLDLFFWKEGDLKNSLLSAD